MNGASSAGVAIAKQYDRDTKIAYVEQIRTGKLREIKAARELGVYKSRIHIWRKKCSEDVEDPFPDSGYMRPDLEYVKKLEREKRQLRNENEFPKKRRRTLQETRGDVSDD